jgi:uncharacterized repeat protein (TIGR01451 family)
VDVDISWQDSTPVEVGAGETARVLTFLVSNLGNGTDSFVLNYEHNNTGSFTPPPENALIYLDSNGDGLFTAGADMQVGDLNISADANATLFVVADIPDANYTGADLSHDGIIATSQSTPTVGVDDQHAVDVVIRKATDADMGEYEIRSYWLSSKKSAVVHSDDNLTHTGTIVTYSIDVFIGGSSAGKAIDGIVMTDIIPVGTSYQTGSMRLNGATLTDVADSDQGIYDGNKIAVNIGTITGSVHQVVTFDVQVQ